MKSRTTVDANDGLTWVAVPGKTYLQAHVAGCQAIRKGVALTDPLDKAEAIRCNDPDSPDYDKPVAWEVRLCKCVR